MIGRVTFPTKTLNNTVTLINSIVYKATDFFQASGYAELRGPLSLSIDINNTSFSPVYIGLQVLLNNNTVMIADRTHIGFLAPFEHKTLSAASIPQLANINGTITEITIFVTTIGTIVQPIIINLIGDAPVFISAPQPIIGKDTSVDQPGQIQVLNGQVQVVAAGAVNVTLASIAANPEIRYLIHLFSIVIFPTVFPGDLFVKVVAAGLPLYVVHSDSERMVNENCSIEIKTPSTMGLSIIAWNYNANQAGTVTYSLLYEPIP